MLTSAQPSIYLARLAPLGLPATVADRSGEPLPPSAERASRSDDPAKELVAVPEATVLEVADDGVSTYVENSFGPLHKAPPEALAEARDITLVGLQAAVLKRFRAWANELGDQHHRCPQQVQAKDVLGSAVLVHADAAAQVYAAQGRARWAEPMALAEPLEPSPRVHLGAAYEGPSLCAPEPAYTLPSRARRIHHVWSTVAEGERYGAPYHDCVFVDAHAGALVCDAVANGLDVAHMWMVGDAVYTPGTAGDAPRYIYPPAKDDHSEDHYPERLNGAAG